MMGAVKGIAVSILSCILLSYFLIPLALPAQTSKEKLQKTKRQLEEEIRYTNDLLEKTQRSKQTSLNKLNILNQQIRSREKLIETMNHELNEVQMDIHVENVQIDQISRDLQKLKTDYARMIYHAYRTMNSRSRLAFILAAKDFNQAYQRLKYYQQYTAYRRNQAERILRTQATLEGRKKSLEQIKSEKVALIDAQEREKQKLDREKKEKAKTIKELNSKEKQLLSTLRTKQQAAQRLQREIEKLIAAEIKASARKEATSADSRDGLALTPSERELSTSFASNQGKLPWPCERGFISGTFGEHAHPVLEYVKVKNNGIDIMTERGSSVRAVFNGKVSKVMSFPNFNKVVIIRHGEYLTVYSNLTDVTVKEGQEIKTRQTIGRVFTSTEDQKTELHFELWKGKTLQNPELWLASRY
jgi:septal ring factor EnvC (AmiA/AmiB activator)